ncbi:MAG: hypothetical protein SPF92_04915 [Clostridia bacterium]|nr:hypothetical protein [Clostridia bacterium]
MRFGRPPLAMPQEYEEYYKLWKDKKITAKQAAKTLGIPLWAFYQKGYKKTDF